MYMRLSCKSQTIDSITQGSFGVLTPASWTDAEGYLSDLWFDIFISRAG